jgi:hypothetical protein
MSTKSHKAPQLDDEGAPVAAAKPRKKAAAKPPAAPKAHRPARTERHQSTSQDPK